MSSAGWSKRKEGGVLFFKQGGKQKCKNLQPIVYLLGISIMYPRSPEANICDYGNKRDKGFEPSPPVWKTGMLAIKHQSRKSIINLRINC